MTSFPKIAYWRCLVPNSECVDKTINYYFKNSRALSVPENEAEFFWFLKSICFSIPVFAETYKNMKKFVREIFKHTRTCPSPV